ncbi:hypothetical protein WBG78_19230 [Chryseolinea sp. T2]|uniref:hypothetical protein n=1 Tax=Chryseolinea sp. T2 TaxID=3129255 RepID=UPI0030779C29
MSKQYIFIPWLRRGLAKQITEPDPLVETPATAQRAGVKLNVSILGDDVQRATVQQELVLVGPGDIVGIDRAAIVKTDPAPGISNFQPNFFPYIEFYEEDFPWRYSPAKAAGERRLRPWIALIVLQESEFQRMVQPDDRGTAKILIGADVAGQALPQPEQSWAWAHVQINDGTATDNDLSDANRNQTIGQILNGNPNLGVSRIMCPRKLDANRKYYAFVVPAFEKGRLAGLGHDLSKIEAAGRFKPSWGGADAVELPVYYEWSFRTGAEDFEALAEKITPLDLSKTEAGRLWMDASEINYGNSFDYNGNLQPDIEGRQGKLPFEGALIVPVDPDEPPPPNILPSMPLTRRGGTTEQDFVKRFAGLINLGVQYRVIKKSNLQWAAEIPGNDVDDPLLVPPIYGKWYANVEGTATVDPLKTTDWLEQLNLDPGFRVAAGLGAEMVRQNQEDFVSRAWEQLTDKRKTLNTELKRLRFAQEVTNATFRKRFNAAATGPETQTNQFLALTQSFHSMVVSDDPGLSVAGQLNGYKADTVFVQPAFRRMTRTNGPIMKKTRPIAIANISMTTVALPFFFEAFIFNPAPPFQNFNSNEKLAKFDLNLFIIRIRIRLSPNFQVPNWFGGLATETNIPRGGLSAMVKQLQDTLLRKPLIIKPAPVNLQAISAKVMARIIPSNSFKNRYKAVMPAVAPAAVVENEQISANSFNPFFTDPTYELLGKAQPELFIPNLDLIKPNSFVLLQSNSAFIEAYLAGMNHEMASEFLWRGYPADMNATFFRRFWDKSDTPSSAADNSDIDFIRNWKVNNGLGTNGPVGSVVNPLVFVIKAELVKNYPNLVVYAQKGEKSNGGNSRSPRMSDPPKLPIFLSTMSPDYLFAGFDLSKAAAMGLDDNDGGYYFVIAERPGEMHFGLDQTESSTYDRWNDLSWPKLSKVTSHIDLQRDIPPSPVNSNALAWGKGESPITNSPTGGLGDSAQMAAILNQKPVRIFVHATQMVSKASTLNT